MMSSALSLRNPKRLYERLMRLPNHRREVWGVGLVKAPISRFLEGWPKDTPTIWLDDPSGLYYADPFAFEIEDRTVLLSERIRHPGARGEIVARELTADGELIDPVSAIPLPLHMSYPSIIQDGQTTYCIPETAQANAVLLFRATGPGPRWRFECKLIEGFAALDSTVIFYRGRFWLFCTQYVPGHNNPDNSHLHIWHAETLAGRWLPHPRNPVKIDRSSARPAGTPFIHRGDLFRPAQDCSRTYGGCVKINRITTLSETDFEEEVAAVVQPQEDSLYPDGMHHLSAYGEWTFIDGKRYIRGGRERRRGLPAPDDQTQIAAALAELAD